MAQTKPRVKKGYTLPPGLVDLKNPIAHIRRVASPFDVFTMAQEHGDFVICLTKPALTYAVYHPDIIQDILENQRHAVVRAANKTGHTIIQTLGYSLLTLDGEPEQQMRRVVEPAFHQDVIAGLATAMTGVADSIQSQWTDGATVDMKAAMEDMVLRIVARSLLGNDIEDDTLFHQTIYTVSRHVTTRSLMPPGLSSLMYKLPLPWSRKVKREVARFDRITYDLIRRRREAGARTEAPALVDMLMQAADPDTGEQLDDTAIRSEIGVSLLTGHHILATSLMWLWNSFAAYPEAAAAVYDEVDNVVGDRLPTLDDVPNLTATNRFILESLRLSPSFYMTFRMTNQETTIGGYAVPPNSFVVIPMMWVQRDPRWWDEPEEFRPERWQPGFRESLHPYAYIPFHTPAPSGCLAEHYAMTAMTLSVAAIARRWRVRLQGAPPKMWYSFNRSIKGSFPLTLERR